MNQRRVIVKSYPIRLGQFLKLAEITSDGLEAKYLIINRNVLVNGIVDTRRGRQLQRDDVVVVDGTSYLCN